MRIPSGVTYDRIKVGDVFEHRLTVTETHLVTAAGMFGDFNPLHVDELFATHSLYGTRIFHGPFTAALMSTAIGIYFAGTAIGFLEHNCRFIAPVRPGDTLNTKWNVTGKVDKIKHDGGIVELAAVCKNQDSVRVAEGEGKVLVRSGDGIAVS
uniref:Acyl dehydratase n=1 Tax=uncultured gamma proteobacterium HF0770_33G18 TaxID=723579 RepID=E7C7L0_9GAMM|nr:acyl dehydratase [uncultured gamma proteobacterium HF0770_33G18]